MFAADRAEASEIVYAVVEVYSTSSLRVGGGQGLVPGSTFTQADVNWGLVVLEHSGQQQQEGD
eukprot:scaffold605549_cov25-Prasinocladus_malaysianus.AAC.1